MSLSCSTALVSKSIKRRRELYSTDLILHMEMTWSEPELPSPLRRTNVITEPSSDALRVEFVTCLCSYASSEQRSSYELNVPKFLLGTTSMEPECR